MTKNVPLPPGMTREELDADLERAAREAEATMNDPYPDDTKVTRPGHAKSVVQSVRLPGDALAAIEQIAADHEVPVGALIRGWVLQALAAEQEETMVGAVDRLIADAERLKRLAS